LRGDASERKKGSRYPRGATRKPRRDTASLALIRAAADAMRLTARGYHRVLRVARTFADLDGSDPACTSPRRCPTGC
jgi:predicted ATPase with chaperone activity